MKSGIPSWHLPRVTTALGLAIAILLPCSSFVLHNTMKVTTKPSSPKTSFMILKKEGPGSDEVDESYFNFGQTKDALRNVATTFSTEVKKNIESAADGFSSVAKRGGEDVVEYAMKVAEFSTDSLRNTSILAAEYATKGTGDLLRLSEQGIYEIQSLSKNGTGKVGEVAKWIDEQARSGSVLVSSKAKSLVLEFTGKEDYTFGDISNALVRKIATKEIAIQDTILVIKLLVALGASIGPLAKVLPLTVLLEALNVSLEQKIGGKVLEALALSIDNRIVAAFSSDDKVQLGDAVKRTVLTGVLAFTGKSKYESGDIQRVIEISEEESDNPAQLDLNINSDLQEWDRLFVERCIESAQAQSSSEAKALDIKISLALEECAKLEENRVKKGIGARDEYFSQLSK
jgi:hypothetical protein